MNVEDIELYVVRGSDGKFFRAKGIAGRGHSWEDEPKKARIYTRIASARSTVTFFTNAYPSTPAPDIVKLVIKEGLVLDEKARIARSIENKKKREAKYQERRRRDEIEYAERERKRAQDDLRRAEDRLKRLT